MAKKSLKSLIKRAATVGMALAMTISSSSAVFAESLRPDAKSADGASEGVYGYSDAGFEEYDPALEDGYGLYDSGSGVISLYGTSSSKKVKKTTEAEANRVWQIVYAYAQKMNWVVTTKNILVSDILVKKSVKFENTKWTMTLEQNTQRLKNGKFKTRFAYKGKNYTSKGVKTSLKKYRVKATDARLY